MKEILQNLFIAFDALAYPWVLGSDSFFGAADSVQDPSIHSDKKLVKKQQPKQTHLKANK